MDKAEFRLRAADKTLDWFATLDQWDPDFYALAAFADDCNALPALRQHCESNADAEYFTDSPRPLGNREMRCLGEIEQYCEDNSQFGMGA